MGLVHEGTETQWTRYTKGLRSGGLGTELVRPNGPGTQRGWDTMGLGHDWLGTQWK